MTEDVAREVALANGLVDNKVCAIDETWSGLRLVYRLRDRPGTRCKARSRAKRPPCQGSGDLPSSSTTRRAPGIRAA